jgi:hypothetical protein
LLLVTNGNKKYKIPSTSLSVIGNINFGPTIKFQTSVNGTYTGSVQKGCLGNRQKKRSDFGLSRPLKFYKLLLVKNFGPIIKLQTSVNGTYTGSEILVKGKYAL